jgi:hypothetical protein
MNVGSAIQPAGTLYCRKAEYPVYRVTSSVRHFERIGRRMRGGTTPIPFCREVAIYVKYATHRWSGEHVVRRPGDGLMNSCVLYAKCEVNA